MATSAASCTRDVSVSLPVRSFSCFAPAGAVTALVGPSGSGKTSILSCVGAQLRPASGAIWLGGIEVTALRGRSLDLYRRTTVGIVHQDEHLLASLTALENVRVAAALCGHGHAAGRRRAVELLERLGLGGQLHHRPGQLSGGQRQRVALARALMADPAIVLADEPTAHLDRTTVAEVHDLLRAVAHEGRTVVVSTHDDRLSAAVDRTIDMAADPGPTTER